MMLKVKLIQNYFSVWKLLFLVCLQGRGRRIHVGGTQVYSRVSATTIAYKLDYTLLRFSHSGFENNYINFIEIINFIR